MGTCDYTLDLGGHMNVITHCSYGDMGFHTDLWGHI